MTGRDRIVVMVIAAVALMAGYWFLLLAPKRQEAAALGAKLTTQTQRLQQAQSAIASGLVARRSYGENYASVARLGEAVPTDDNVPSLVYQVDAAARAAHVDFRAVKLSQSGSAAATSSAAPAASGAASASAKSSAPATQSATATLPPGASVGPAGFPTMPFSFTFDGSFFHMDDFLHRLDSFVRARNQHVSVGGRLLTVNGFSLGAGRRGFPFVKASVSATAYLLPADEGLTAGATPSAPGSAAGAARVAGASGSAAAPPTTATPPAP